MTAASQGHQGRTVASAEARGKAAVSRLAGWPAGRWSQVKELAGLLEEEQDAAEKAEIIKTLFEVLFPEGLGAVADAEGDADDAARRRLQAYRRKVGLAIRQRRKELGMTQEQLAASACLPQSHVSRLEKGRHAPTQQTMERVAAALKTTPSRLDPGCEDEEEAGEAGGD